MKISVVIPTYNEEKHIGKCVESLLLQNYPDFEIIVVDDGSSDNTPEILSEFAASQKIIFLKSNHLGPAHARNLGVSLSSGEILVFVDADMNFEQNFLKDLSTPIVQGKSKGTFSKEEYVANWGDKLAKFWQYNRGLFENKMIGKEYETHAPVFRAILKSEFLKVHGFDETIGYTDDWSLSRKLGYESTLAKGAIYYHNNPCGYKEVWQQARWIGKNEFISGTMLRVAKSLLKYNFLSSIIKGIKISFKTKEKSYLLFQLLFDFAVLVSVAESFVNVNKNK